VKEEIKAANK
jgi:serine/threonine protein kinase